MLLALPIGMLIGLSLGALGGGGSILTVPALVYLLGESPGNVHRVRGPGEPVVLDHGEEQAQPADVERRHPVPRRCHHVRIQLSCS